MIWLKRCFLLFSLLHGIPYVLLAQDDKSFGSIEELKKEADKLFKAKDYAGVAPLFSQLVSNYPDDPLYNYKYGVSLFHTAKNRVDAIPFLDKGSRGAKTPYDVFYYLGRCYHLNYQFDEAISMYNQFRGKAKSTEMKDLDVERLIQNCNNGKEVTKGLNSITILNKKEIARDAFFSAYDFSRYSGRVLGTPDNFKQEADKKKKLNSTVFLSNEKGLIYYGSLGKDGAGGLDIYIISKTETGEWGIPEKLGSGINTSLDEDYPFVTPDGSKLYFSSKGHNSIGGYDIFVCTWNEETKTWSSPQNMGIPVNSPDDDFFYTTRTDEDIAFFTTARESAPGKVMVYQVQVAGSENQLALIRGKYLSRNQPHRLDAKISVLKAETNELVGVYNTQIKSGEYELTLPKGITYRYIVEAEGYLPHSELVTIPKRLKKSVLKQEIRMRKNDTAEEMVILNYFGPLDEEETPLASAGGEKPQEIVSTFRYDEENKKQLEAIEVGGQTLLVTPPTLTVEQSASGEIPAPAAELGSQKTFSDDLSNQDIVKIAYNDARTVEDDAKKLEREAQLALTVATEKDSIAKAETAEAEAARQRADALPEGEEKKVEMEKVKTLEEDAAESVSIALAAQEQAANLQEEAKARREEAEAAMANAKEIERAVASGATPKSPVRKDKPAAPARPVTRPEEPPLVKAGQEESPSSKNPEALLARAELLKNEAGELQSDAEDIRTSAEGAAEPGQKENMLRQADSLDAMAATRLHESENARMEAQQLQADAGRKPAAGTENTSEEPAGISAPENPSASSIPSSQDPSVTPSQPSVSSTTPDDPGSPAVPSSDMPGVSRTATSVVDTPGSQPTAGAAPDPNEDPRLTAFREEKRKEAAGYLSRADELEKESENLTIQVQQINEQAAETKKKKEKELLLDIADSLRKSAEEKLTEAEDLKTRAEEAEELAADHEKLKEVATAQGLLLPDPSVTEPGPAAPDSPSVPDPITASGEASDNLPAPSAEQAENSSSVISGQPTPEASVPASSDSTPSATPPGVASSAPANPENTATPVSPAVIVSSETTADPSRQIEQIPALAAFKQEKLTEVEQMKAKAAVEEREADQLSEQSRELTIQADGVKKKKEKEALLARADSFATASQAKQEQAEQTMELAGELEAVVNNSSQLIDQAISRGVVTEQQLNAVPPSPSVVPEPAFETASAPVTEPAPETGQPAEASSQQPPATSGEQAAATPGENPPLSGTPESAASPSPTGEPPAAAQPATSTPSEPVSSQESAPASEPATASASQVQLKKAEEATAKAQEQEDESTRLAQESMSIFRNANSIKDPVERKKALDRADKLNVQSIEMEKEARKNRELAEQYQTQAQNVPAAEPAAPPAALTPSTATPSSGEPGREGTAAELEESKPATPPTYSGGTVGFAGVSETNAPAPVRKVAAAPAEFTISPDAPAYSESNPIPVDVALPEGLIFKVQIGAFRNPIPQDLFKGIRPITGERTPAGLTRYTAGVFKTFEPANLAKREIRNAGYRDAFVVAYLNGKRISLIEASDYVENDMPAAQKEEYRRKESEELRALQSFGITPDKLSAAPGDITSAAATPDAATAATPSAVLSAPDASGVTNTPLQNTGGLLYTIQVGVYRSAAVPPALSGIRPLNREQTRNGMYKYTSGVYSRFVSADSARRSVSGTIPDAFVVIYYNGQRIPLARARELEGTGGGPAFTGQPAVAVTDRGAAPVAGDRITFRVQVGAFREKVPANYVDYYFRIIDKGITSQKDDNGTTFFYAGSAGTVEEAQQLRAQIIAAGVTDAFIVGFRGNRKITFAEARRLLNQ